MRRDPSNEGRAACLHARYVWIDANGLVRKLSMEVSGTDQASQAGAATISFELWDYGESVDIELPPSSQVADASALHG